MKIDVASNCSRLGEMVENLVKTDKALDSATNGFELQVGLATDSKYGVPAHAEDAIFVGDSAHIIGQSCDAYTEAMFKAHPERVDVRPVYDREKNGWKYNFTSRQATDALDLIGGQLFSPWNISYFKRVFQRPMTYSNFKRFVTIESGTDPWTELFTLFYEDYAGWAMTNETGDLQNQATADVNVVNGLMSAKVINLSVTYSITLEEQKRSNHRNPFGGQTMVSKQRYANYVLDMLSNKIGYFGNPETETLGIINTNPIRIYGGRPLDVIYNDTTITGTARGSEAYRALAMLIIDFMAESDNKINTIRIGMAPKAHDILQAMPYSDVYDATSAIRIFLKNFGVTDKDASKLRIEFISEPFLKSNSWYNPDPEDLLIMTSPEIGGGPDDVPEPLILYGQPLSEFVFPAVPGMYNTQYKTLKRVAGVFAPVPGAIRVYKGYGTQG